ncbi:oligosaccharide flippase family protein [Massilimicrobiota timonensis]|uniref:Flippase n=1 Tax=Massilimicrobiota timonensis TaxID=1776392 RepID=A0A1Y4SNV2_9FIRM|nr:oligosaccharide flippase family protein [Massilimicrobiota timonensis]OUQ31576.1 flippase [Massilimicrobiota timonensis]
MGSSIKKNFLYNAFYNILTLILPLITAPYISRVMGPERIGEYSYAYSIASYFGLFILLGLNNYGNRTIASIKDDLDKLNKSFWSIYFMQFIASILVIAIYLIYAMFFAENSLMAFIQTIYIISVALDINWFFFGLEQFKLTVTRNTVIKIITVLSIFIFVKQPSDLYKYALIMVLGPLGSQLFLWTILRKYIKFVKVGVKDIIQHIKPNLILFIPVIAISLYTIMSKIILGNMSNMTEVGYFESANKITQIPAMAVTSLGTVMLPRVSNLVANGKNQESLKYLQKSLVLSVFLSTSMAFGLSAISKEFVPFFYGGGYEKCIIIIPILVISSIFMSWANVIRTQYLIPYKKDHIYIQSVFLGAFINILLNILLIPYFQSIGSSIATLCTEASVCIYQTIKVRDRVNIRLYVSQSFPFLVIALIMYFIVIYIPFITNFLITIIIKVIIGAAVYLILSVLYYKKLKID